MLQKLSHGARPGPIPIGMFPDRDIDRIMLSWLCHPLRGMFARLEVLIFLSSASSSRYRSLCLT